MNYTPFVVWGLLAIGVVVAVVLGGRASNWVEAFLIAFGSGVTLALVTNFALAACVTYRRCLPLGDTGIVYVFYPLLAIPAFWLVAGLRATFK